MRTATTTDNRLRSTTSHPTAKHHRRNSDIARISAPKHHRRNDTLPKLSTPKLAERRHLPVGFPSSEFLFVSLLSLRYFSFCFFVGYIRYRGRRDSCAQITDGTIGTMTVETTSTFFDSSTQTGKCIVPYILSSFAKILGKYLQFG